MRALRFWVWAQLLVSIAAGEALKTPVWTDGAATGLEVTLDGRPAEVTATLAPDEHLILLLVMDTVKYPDRVDAARDALVRKLRELGKKYFVGVFTAQDGLAVQLDPVRGRNKLRDTLQSLDVRGMPGLLDVVEQASQIADRTLAAAPVRLAVLFVTDGAIGDYRGHYTIPVVNPSDQRDLSRRFRDQLILARIRHAVDALESAQAPLFFLHLARSFDNLNEVYQNGISEFARVTGGTALFAQGLQEIPAMVDRLLDEIAAVTVLTIEGECASRPRLVVRSPQGVAKHRDKIGCPVAGS